MSRESSRAQVKLRKGREVAGFSLFNTYRDRLLLHDGMTVEGIADFRCMIVDLQFCLPTSAFLLYMPSPAFPPNTTSLQN